MKYITTHELSEKWGISQRRIVRLASEGRIKGAKLYGKSWVFPIDVQKPVDGRSKKAKVVGLQANDTASKGGRPSPSDVPANFRCPIFEYRNLGDFTPSLNAEERTIKAATETFIACKYEEARTILGDLSNRTKDRYIRIAALYTGCMCDIFLFDEKGFYDNYGRLREEFVEDFPYKTEMEQYLHLIDAALGDNSYYASWPANDFLYQWHESFLSRLSNLSNVWLSTGENKPTKRELAACERNCLLLEKIDAPFDLQALHVYLGCAYATQGMRKEGDFHFIEALKLAEKYDMFYSIALYYFYMRGEFASAMSKFSEEFRQKVIDLSDDYQERFIKFTEKIGVENFHKKLSSRDYIFISLALQHLSYSGVAKRLNVSEATVARRYGEIYKRLGVAGKAELVEMFGQEDVKI